MGALNRDKRPNTAPKPRRYRKTKRRGRFDVSKKGTDNNLNTVGIAIQSTIKTRLAQLRLKKPSRISTPLDNIPV